MTRIEWILVIYQGMDIFNLFKFQMIFLLIF